MSWELEIHIIDVGQGESSLIIAKNNVTNESKTMLIDGGLSAYAKIVHDYITKLGLAGVDYILTSHYDKDHCEGIKDLLVADNLYKICDVIARAAAAEVGYLVDGYNKRANQIVTAAAAAYVAAIGAYKLNDQKDCSNIVRLVGTATHIAYPDVYSDDKAVKDGIKEADRVIGGQNINPSLIKSASKQKDVSSAAGIAAANAITNGYNVLDAIREAVFKSLKATVPVGSRFNTGGIYCNTRIIDIGDGHHIIEQYKDAITGGILMSSNYKVTAPQINRKRKSLSAEDLGKEILWNIDGVPAVAVGNRPAIFVVSCLKNIWNGYGYTSVINSGEPDNDDSIGLILRFNKFFYYTGGDLPSEGEDIIANAIMTKKLRSQADETFALPSRIACFKCGHHGSNKSTSTSFLNKVHPKGAFISVGKNTFGSGDNHPTQDLINRLHNSNDIKYFYLTNCYYQTEHIPASSGESQLMSQGNKSRVAGNGGSLDNLNIGRVRGDIKLSISEDESKGVGNQQFHVAYYDEDSDGDMDIEIGVRIEDIAF